MARSTDIVDIQLHQIDRNILLDILPSNVWAQTSKVLEKKHPSSLENLSNSSVYFQNLILSKRVLFLFPQVLKLIGPQFANLKTSKTEDSTIIKCRIVCKQWNQAVDQFIISDTLEPNFFNTPPPQPSDHALVNARYQYFGYMSPTKLPQFLAHFQHTHLPHSSRNQFIGKVVYIDLIGFTDRTQWASIADQVSTLLRKYGHQIKILNLGLFQYHEDPNIQLQKYSWLLEWLENCPNLTHLKVSERFNLNDNLDIAFGNRPEPERARRLREMGTEVPNFDLADMINQSNRMWALSRRLQCDYRMEDQQRERNNLSRAMEQNMHDLKIVRGLGANYYHQARRPVTPVQQPPVPQFPTLKNLQCLKFSYVSALNFNSIISTNTHVTWLHIEPLNVEKDNYIDYHALDYPKLLKFYVHLCSPKEVRKLNLIHPSLLSLTHLHFEYCSSDLCTCSHKFMEWTEIFGVILQNWGNSLTDLKLRLPIPKTKKEKEKVVRDSGNFRLNLPNLKRLKIWLSDELGVRVAKMDFLDLVSFQLEQLIIE